MRTAARGWGATIAVSSVAALGIGAAPAGAKTAKYPDAVVSAFVTSCTRTAVASSDGEVTEAQARSSCRAAIKCIQRELTLREFKLYVKRLQSGARNPGARAVNRCVRRAAASVSA